MQSSRTSDHVRLRRAVADPWALGIAAGSGAAVTAIGWGAPVVGAAAAAIVAVRVGAEYLVPRASSLELEDSMAAQERQVRSSLAAAVTSVEDAPPEVAARVEAIRRIIVDLFDRDRHRGAHWTELFVLLRTATDYLPAALDAYLSLPAGYATTRRVDGGRTALELLLDQLELLETEMLGVTDAVSRNDVDRLLAHGRFLADRFGRSELAVVGEAGR